MSKHSHSDHKSDPHEVKIETELDEASVAPAVEEKGGANQSQPEPEATINLKQLQDIERLVTESKENYDKYLRANADLENYKKRARREKEDAIRYVTEDLLQQLLPVIDSFDMGMQAVEQGHDPASIAQGVKMIHAQLNKLLDDLGIEVVDVAEGEPFDHHLHEALGTQETHDHPEGTVLSQIRKGYKIKNRLVRPATVYVSKSPTTATDEKPNGDTQSHATHQGAGQARTS